MSKFTSLDDRLHDYLVSVAVRENPVMARLRAETAKLPQAGMQISPDQAAFMQFLVRALGVKNYLEIGVFTGYSTLAVALALGEDGRITALDRSAEWTAIAQRYWAEAGMAGKIDLRLAPAGKTLDALLAAGRAGGYDFAFIDADKENYLNYYERCLTLLRPGGLVLVDNVLWGGRAADPANHDDATVAIRRLTQAMHADERIDFSLLPVGDGLSLAVKR